MLRALVKIQSSVRGPISKSKHKLLCFSLCGTEVVSTKIQFKQMVHIVLNKKIGEQALKNVQSALCWRPVWRPTVRWRVLL